MTLPSSRGPCIRQKNSGRSAHYTLKANHRLSAVGMRKSPGTLGVSEAQIILRILLSVVDDVAVIADCAENTETVINIAM